MVKGRETRKNRCLFILWMLRIFSLLPSHFASAILHKTLELPGKYTRKNHTNLHSEEWARSTVAHFARKVRATDTSQRTLYLRSTYKAPCGRFQRHKRNEKRCTPKRTLVYTFINVSDAAMLRRRILRNQYLLSVDEVDALRQSNEARALHVTVEEADA